ncbi:MAG TPA: acyl-CoA dehydrogenase family protein [Candidatus Binatia bacterium]|nr:acyl-CoA dehydrogenase family protein [Candidatus Binatia bacterium]
MVDFDLSDEQRARQTAAREFAARHITPVASAIDRGHDVPWDVVEAGVRAGWTTMLVPARYGGGGFDNLSAGLVLEELGAACSGIATLFGASILGTGPIVLLGSEEQKQRLLGRIAADSTGRFLCAFAVTEASAGSASASGDPHFGVQSKAVRRGDDYVLNGSKRFISNGSVARLYSVLARTHPTKPAMGGLSFFAVDADAGVAVGTIEDKMGQRACPTAELHFDDVIVPAENLLGREGLGSIGLMQTISFSTPLVAAVCLGVARAALDLALAHARSTAPPLTEEQATAMRLFDMAAAIEAARTLVWRVLWGNDQRMDRETGRLRGTPNLKLAAMAKVLASETCVRVAHDAIEIIGPSALVENHPAGKLLRDARLMPIYEGTNQIHRIATARLL